MGDGVTFLTAPAPIDFEITGPSALKLFVSSSTSDADIFVVLRVFSPDMKEVVFQGAIDPHTPVAQGWLRASHRKLDKKLSKPWRPYHTHDKKQPLKKGEVVELDIEIWPTSIVVPKGYRSALSIRGKDYVYPGPSGGKLSNFKNELTGCGPFLHDDPRDRPPEIFGGITTLHFGGKRQAFMLVPMIPPKQAKSCRSFRGARSASPKSVTPLRSAIRAAHARPGMTTQRNPMNHWNKYEPTAARKHGKPGREARPQSRSPSTSTRMSRCRRRRNSSSRISIR